MPHSSKNMLCYRAKRATGYCKFRQAMPVVSLSAMVINLVLYMVAGKMQCQHGT